MPALRQLPKDFFRSLYSRNSPEARDKPMPECSGAVPRVLIHSGFTQIHKRLTQTSVYQRMKSSGVGVRP